MTSPASPHDARQALIDAARQIMARKGFRAVGITEILAAAKVPKGSFYHYFPSKDAFGQVVMHDYLAAYLAAMDRTFATAEDASERLLAYFADWRARQIADNFTAGCLIITLGPEAANFADDMREEIRLGVDGILDRLEQVIVEGVTDGSMRTKDPKFSAQLTYDAWLGASVVAKIGRTASPFDMTRDATMLHLRIVQRDR